MNPGTHESQDLLIPGLTNPGIHEPCDSRIIGLKRILGVPHSRDSIIPGIQALLGCNASRHSTYLGIPPVESRDPQSWDLRLGILSPGILSPDIRLLGFSPYPIPGQLLGFILSRALQPQIQYVPGFWVLGLQQSFTLLPLYLNPLI